MRSGGLTLVTADPADAKTGPVTLHRGSNLVTLTWVARTSGAAIVGTIANLDIYGVSVQPDPHTEDFDVAGARGSGEFHREANPPQRQGDRGVVPGCRKAWRCTTPWNR
jgi:hypothetical protein